MTLRLQRRRFRFALLQPLRTAAGELRERCGWLLRLDDDQGGVGWGEVAPLQLQQFMACEQALAALPDELPQAQLEAVLREAPGAGGFWPWGGLGGAAGCGGRCCAPGLAEGSCPGAVAAGWRGDAFGPGGCCGIDGWPGALHL